MIPETETRIAQLMADIARLSHQVVDLQNERDGLEAQVEACSAALKSLLKTPLGIGGSLQSDGKFYYKVPESVFKKAESTLAKTPQQHLAEIRAEAGRAGFVAGAVCARHPLKPNAVEIKESADEYAAKVRQGGEE